jgi:hypothetical protein
LFGLTVVDVRAQSQMHVTVARSTRFAQDAVPAIHSPHPTLRLHRRIALAFLLFSLAAALAWSISMLVRIAPIGSAYAAKTLCSAVFVSGRPAHDVIEEDILADNNPLLRAVVPALDTQQRQASATFLGVAERVALFRPGFGCTLALGVEPAALAQAGAARRTLQQLPTDALPASLPPEGSDRARLEAALAHAFDNVRARTRAVAVLYDGHLIGERYAAGFSARTPMPGWSMTKTAVAALTGVLVQRGTVRLDQSNLLDEWRAPGDARATITIEHLLRMTDGLAFYEAPSDPLSDVVHMLLSTGDSAAFAVAKPLRSAPGATWRYSSGSTIALMLALRRATGLSPERFAKRCSNRSACVARRSSWTPPTCRWAPRSCGRRRTTGCSSDNSCCRTASGKDSGCCRKAGSRPCAL